MKPILLEYKCFQIRAYLESEKPASWTAEILDSTGVAFPPSTGKASLAKALRAAYEDADWLIDELQQCVVDW